jgi:uncharacterized protein YjiS (DUF1127 family)
MTTPSISLSARVSGPEIRPAFIAGRLLAWLNSAIVARRTRVLLGELDDRTLKDIGLHRSEIMSLAHRPCSLSGRMAADPRWRLS